MTEKRFNYEYSDDKFYDKGFFLDNGKRMFKDEVLNTLNELHEKKEMWKRECQRLKGLYYLENEKVELDDIIGLVKTDEPTDSVELKKELYK